ncbi:MAG: glycosyltransferase family 2 protein [Thomasclavelia sp.]|nr:glycosyltransferase family 2 protein [Thomasclavelia sp.]
MSKVDVTVIIPVYNSEKYLSTAIDSILNQNYESMEILLIDDGSSDGSSTICDDYSKKDNRIKTIHKENEGMCASRNLGLSIAKGEYILFCDNDDVFLPNLIKDNIDYAKKYDADIVKFARKRINYIDDKVIEEAYSYKFDFKIVEEKDILKYYNIQRNISSGVWCNLYKKSVIQENNVRFPESFRFGCEDYYFNIEYYKYVKTMVMNPKAYYQWNLRMSHSTTRKYSDNLIESLQICLDLEYKYILEKDLTKLYPGNWEDILTNYYVFGYYLALQNKACPYSKKKKKSMVREFAKNKCFTNIDKNSLKHLKSLNFKRYVILKLFLYGFHGLNFRIINFYSKKVSKIA